MLSKPLLEPNRRDILRDSYIYPNHISDNNQEYKKFQEKNIFDYRFTSIFACITNYEVSVLGSGKTLTNLFLFWYRMRKLENAIGFSNIQLKNFKPQIQKRIRYYSNFAELEELLKELNKNKRSIILEDEAQNEFDKRQATSKAQIHKTYFLNFFRKFNTEMYFNVINLNRLEFRLEDMCNYIYIPLMLDKVCVVYELKYGNAFYFKTGFFYNKYDTLEYIAPTLEKETDYLIKRLSQDKTFKSLVLNGSKLR